MRKDIYESPEFCVIQLAENDKRIGFVPHDASKPVYTAWDL